MLRGIHGTHPEARPPRPRQGIMSESEYRAHLAERGLYYSRRFARQYADYVRGAPSARRRERYNRVWRNKFINAPLLALGASILTKQGYKYLPSFKPHKVRDIEGMPLDKDDVVYKGQMKALPAPKPKSKPKKVKTISSQPVKKTRGVTYKKMQSSKKQYRRRRPRKSVKKASNAKLSTEVKQIKKSLSKMKKLDDATIGSLTVRLNAGTDLNSSALNQQGSKSWSILSTDQIEADVINKLKFFDPSNPGTLITANAAAGTFQRNILIDYASMTIHFKNNYQVECELDVYLCRVKDDTDQTVIDAWDAGVPDGSNLPDKNALHQFPTDYNVVNDLYQLKKLKTVKLQAGESCSVSHYEKDIEYDPSTVDTHALSYQREYKSFQFLATVRGLMSHDTTLFEEGIQRAALDVEVRQVYKVKYSAGTNIAYIDVTNTYDTPTNNFVSSNKPANSNQSYSR